MKSKRTVILVLTAALIVSAKPVLAKELNSNMVSNTTNATISNTVSGDKLTALSEKEKAKISPEEAKVSAKNILRDYFETDIDDAKFQATVNYNSNYSNDIKTSVWSIHWYSQIEDKDINLNVDVDGTTGKVIRVDKNEYNHKKNSQPIATITEEQAKEIGETFLKKINPEEFKETKLLKDNSSVRFHGMSNYSFAYNRTINNISFNNNSIRIGVDGVTGKVMSYEIIWDNNVKAPSSDKVIDQKAADDIFNKNTKLELTYNTGIEKPNDTQENKTKLVYAVDSSSPIIIDAENGKALTWNGDYFESVKTRNVTDSQKEDIAKNAKAIQKLDNPISSQRAEQVIKEKLKNLYGDIYEINSINYQDEGYAYNVKGLKVWACQFVKKDSNTNFGPPEGHISINALTEELVRIDRFNFNEKENKENEKFQPKITWEQAYDKAIQFIANNCPQKIKEINTEQKNLNNQLFMYGGDQANRYISFNFGRVVNGVSFNNNGMPYNNDGIVVAFDTKTGEMNSYSCMWQDKLDLPPVEKTVSSDEAKKTFLNANKPQLTYLLLNNKNSTEKSNKKMQLVYSIGSMNNPLNTVDAYTGKLLNFYGENVDDNMEAFKAKIKGSAVEKEASILASQGIIDTKDFKLDAGITRIQLVKILVNAKGFNPYLKGVNDVNFTKGVGEKGSLDYKYVQLGVMYGIIQDQKDEFKGNEMVTREEVAKSLIKLLGYEKVAELKGILNVSYPDSSAISADKTGYVSLAGGLKLIEADKDGKIRPKDNVTMSELIKAVYMALGSLQK